MAAKVAPNSNTVAQALEKWADIGPEAEAFIFLDSYWNRWVLTRAELHKLSGRCAAMLELLGVKQGDLVCNTFSNGPERLIVDLGTMLIGAIALDGRVVLDYHQDFLKFLLDTGCNVLLYDTEMDEDVVEHLSEEMYAVKANGHRFYPNLPNLNLVLECHLTMPRGGDRAKKYKDCLSLICSLNGPGQKQTTCAHRTLMDVIQDDFFLPHVVKVPPDAAAVVWSAACITDEVPKLVLRSQGQLFKLGKSLNEFLSLKSDDVYYCDFPLSSIWGCIAPYLVSGVARVMTDYSRPPVDDSGECLYEALLQEGCTAAFLDQTRIINLARHIRHIQDPKRDKGRPVPTEDGKKTSRKSKLTLQVLGYEFHPVKSSHLRSLLSVAKKCISVYGRCETGVISWRKIDLAQSDNVGRPALGVLTKIVGAVAGVGEIVVKTDQNFSGYFSLKDKTADKGDASDTCMKVCSPGDWVLTGDIGNINSNGQLNVFCHKKNAITLPPSSHKIYPGWLERKLSLYPGVRQVMLVPLSDSKNTKPELCLCVVLESWSQVTTEYLKSICLGLFYTRTGPVLMAIPDHYVITKKDMPAYPDGKLSRRAMLSVARKYIEDAENCGPQLAPVSLNLPSAAAGAHPAPTTAANESSQQRQFKCFTDQSTE